MKKRITTAETKTELYRRDDQIKTAILTCFRNPSFADVIHKKIQVEARLRKYDFDRNSRSTLHRV